MKFLQLLLFIGIFCKGNYVLGSVLPQESHVNRKLMILGGEEGGAPCVVFVNVATPCSGVVIKPGYVITDKSCVKAGDTPKVCQAPAAGDCAEGIITVKSVSAGDAAVILTIDNDKIAPCPLVAASVAATAECEVIGFGKTAADAETASDAANTIKLTVESVDDKTITFAAAEGLDVCEGDSGGAINCGGSLAGIVSTLGGCDAAAPVVAINLFGIKDWIEKETGGGAGNTSNGTGSYAPYLGATFITAIFPAIILMLIFP